MSAWQLENLVRTLESWGLTDVLLPFLLIFVIMTEPQGVSIPFDFWMAGAAFVLALLVGLVSSAYPAILAARLDPNAALRAL